MGARASKLVGDVAAALRGLDDGACVMVGGFGLCGNPEALIQGVVQRAPRELTLISNNAGNLGQGLATWLRAGLVRKVICTYLGNNDDLHQAMAAGTVEVQVLPQGTFVERIRAAGAGLAAFYTPTGVGTVVAEGKEVRDFDGRPHLLEHALSADFALVRAQRADTYGNARFWRTTKNFQFAMASAARTTVLEADEVCAHGDLDPDDVHLPGIFIDRVVEVREHADPFEYRRVRSADEVEGGADEVEGGAEEVEGGG